MQESLNGSIFLNRQLTLIDVSLIFIPQIFNRSNQFFESYKIIIIYYYKILLMQESGRNFGVQTPW